MFTETKVEYGFVVHEELAFVKESLDMVKALDDDIFAEEVKPF